jgi:hypothetical protein
LGEQQVPPLRCAPVGMTNLFGSQGRTTAAMSSRRFRRSYPINCHPDRSVAQWSDLLFLYFFIALSWRIHHSINPNLRAPKAITDVSIRHEPFQVQLAPPMQTEPAKQVLDGIGLVFSVRPQLCQRSCECFIRAALIHPITRQDRFAPSAAGRSNPRTPPSTTYRNPAPRCHPHDDRCRSASPRRRASAPRPQS